MLERCQFENSIYRYTWPLGHLRSLRRALRKLRRKPDQSGLGAASRFADGDWVRVRDAAGIRATLDKNGATRGLSWVEAMWPYCEQTFQVDGVLQRMMDDAGRMRSISRTVKLAGVYCDGVDKRGGCGRACPLMFRDEWLEPSSAPPAQPPAQCRYARVRTMAEIRATLDRNGRRDGIMVVPEMALYAGSRFSVRKHVEPVAERFWRRRGPELYVLEGLLCRGLVLESAGPCHRGCHIVWHRDWLDLDAADRR